MLNDLVALKVIVPGGDTQSLKRTIQFFLDRLGERAQRSETVQQIGDDLFSVALDQPFRFPSQFVFVLRAFSTLEGIGKSLAGEDFSIAKSAAPYAQRLLAQEDRSSAAQSIQRQVESASSNVAMLPDRVERIDRIVSAIDDGSLRPSARFQEGERAFRRLGIVQSATLQTVASLGLLNLALNSTVLEAHPAVPVGVLSTSLALALSVSRQVNRVRRIDRFERAKRGGESE